MKRAFDRIFFDGPHDVRWRTAGIFLFLLALNGAAWTLSLLAFASRPLLLGTAILAYSFGLRHAVDADHISAIDNVTRKLMQERKRPVAVGFFFSLGHSTIVIALSLAIAFVASTITTKIPSLQSLGGLLGTSMSAGFLLAIAAVNILILAEIVQTFRRVQRGETYSDQSLDEFLAQRGLMGRFFKPLLRMVDSSWHMYPIGVLFGLGFDTATEVAVLGIAAIEGARGLPIYFIMIFPLLFMAGMSLVDTADGILMLGAYGWAYARPVRKLYYNLSITLVSVVVALVVGSIEALRVVSKELNLTGWFWEHVNAANGSLGTLGFLIVGLFVGSWALSMLIYKLYRYDQLDVRIEKAESNATRFV